MKPILKSLLIAAFLISGVHSYAQTGNKQFSFDDFFKNGTFREEGVYGLRSMKDGLHYTTMEKGTELTMFSYETGEKVKTLLSAEKIAGKGIRGFAGYAFSNDEKKILLTTDRVAIYRRSFTANYFVYDIEKEQLIAVSEKGPQQLATFSPDGNKIAFVRKNNLFIIDLASKEEKQITADGEFNKIINGVPDWVYEEEFEYNKAFDWSPDGKYIAFCRFDESAVKMFSMTVYKGLKPEIKQNALYPENRQWKYPKAGDDNSVLTVNIYDVSTGKTIPADIGAEKDQYIPRIKWTNVPGKLCIYRLNRLQNKMELLLADASSGNSEVFYTEENKYYFDEKYFDDISFLKKNDRFMLLSEKDGFTHVYIYDLKGKLINQVTKGNWDVTKLIGFDEKNDWVYYQSVEESAIRKSVYAIHSDGKGKHKLSTQTGNNDAEFSSGFQYYINSFSSASSPAIITLNKANGKQIRVLEENTALKDLLKQYKFNYKEFFRFTTSENVSLNGWMIKPPDFDPNKKYPVFMTQYSGPGSQSVADDWSIGWDYLLAQNGYVIICVDGRGTGCRGEEFRKMTYLQLGKFETLDQIETAKYMGKQSYVDASRIGIWGWSFGGFMAASCLTKGADYFKMGIAVAPVTNWRYYDNIYTERFLRKPQDNPSGYDDNSPINFADKLKGKLLIVHGTADDNVHFQNTTEFAEALVQANKQFDMHVYTNRNHGIRGGNTSYHLYTLLYNYIQANL
jgi:dipeptidyl-peptidase-4